MKKLFYECKALIERAYKSNKNLKFGWRFLYGPKSTLKTNNGMLILGLNPGGSEFQIIASVESGNAYLREIEEWPTQLQNQMRLLFEQIDKNNWRSFLNKTLTSNFIPFRSPDFQSLPDKNYCLNFSENLWGKILQEIILKTIICIGNGKFSSYRLIKDLLSKQDWVVIQEEKIPLWANFTLKLSTITKNANTISIIGLPHLSRCPIFGKNKSYEIKIIDIVSRTLKYAR